MRFFQVENFFSQARFEHPSQDFGDVGGDKSGGAKLAFSLMCNTVWYSSLLRILARVCSLLALRIWLCSAVRGHMYTYMAGAGH